MFYIYLYWLGRLSLTLVRLMKLSSMKLLDECSPETVEEEKNNLYFFLKGGFNKLERSTILSLILKLSLSTKL